MYYTLLTLYIYNYLLPIDIDELINRFANDLTIHSNGTIYFTDSSKYYRRDNVYDVFESRCYGRLLSYTPNKGTKVLLHSLCFPNGIQIDPIKEEYLLFSQTTRYKITKYFLTGK